MAFILVLVYIAVLFIRPMEWLPIVRGVPILDFVAGATILATLIQLPQSKWKLKNAPQNLLLIGFFFACLMSHVRHGYLEAFGVTFQTFGKLVLLYFLIVMNVNSVRRFRLLVAVMIAGCLFMTFHGILQYHRGVGLGGLPPIYDHHRGEYRVVGFGFFNDPNDLALILVTVLPFIIRTSYQKGVAIVWRVLSVGAIAAMCYCIFRTNSRGGWLALGAMLTTYFVTHFASKKVGIIVGICVVLMLFVVGPSRLGSTGVGDASARGRLIAWADGNRMLKQWPIFGAGYGRYKEFSEGSKVAHNSYVHCWAELGLFGYFFWLGLLLASLKDAYFLGRIKSDDPEHREIGRLAKVAVCALLGYMAAAFFLSRTYVPPLYVLFALFATLRRIHDENFGPLEGEFVRSDLKYVLLATVASVPLLYAFLRVAI